MLSWDRNKITACGWEFEQVSDFSAFDGFDCADDDLNDFILNDAKRHKQEMIAETYSFRFVEQDEQGRKTVPVAFVSLANDVIVLSKGKKRKHLHYLLRGYDSYPAVKIARLGVHRIVQGSSIGTQLIELIKCLLTTHNRTGCRFLNVDAYNKDNILKFYIKNDFQLLDEECSDDEPTRIMYYDLKRFTRLPQIS